MNPETIPRKTWRQRLKAAFSLKTLILLALLIGEKTGLSGYIDSIIFQPRAYIKAEWPELDRTIEDVWFQSSDGLRLNGWYAETPKPRAIVLYMHGNAGNIGHRQSVIDLFRDRLQCSVLLFDYRGYGRSEGMPSEAGVLADARAARTWLARTSGVAEEDIVLVGRSLGGGVAVDLSAKDGARGLILESTFTSLPDVAAKSVKILPVRLLVRTRLDSLSKIPNYQGPLLQSHGDADRVIPIELGDRLFKAARGSKRFVRIPGGGHNDPPTREYLDALDRFLDELPATGKPH
jgi:fermentation-respiration switch protein FrsA (DUF1100 family)